MLMKTKDGCGKYRVQDSGGWIRESGVRSGNEEHLMPAFCFLLSADCLLNLREAGWRQLLAGMADLDWMSPLTGEGRKEPVT
jgi:hypothetical protein